MSTAASSRLLAPVAALLALTALTACGPTTSTSGEPAPGYGAGVTASNDVLTRAQIDQINASRMTELFENRFSGVNVQTFNGRATVVIRGYPDPLIVIDGVPQGDSQTLWSLQPREIQEIRILRDVGTSSYGTRGQHGVVEVTTRDR